MAIDYRMFGRLVFTALSRPAEALEAFDRDEGIIIDIRNICVPSDFVRLLESLRQLASMNLTFDAFTRCQASTLTDLSLYEEALSVLVAASENTNVPADLLLMLVHAHLAVGNVKQAGEAVRPLIEACQVDLSCLDIPDMILAADRLFVAGEVSAACKLYYFINQCELLPLNGLLRLSEHLLASSRYQDAYDTLIRVQKRLDVWGLCVLAASAAFLNRFEEADEYFVSICLSQPNVDYFWQRWFESSIKRNKNNNVSSDIFFHHLTENRNELSLIYRFRIHLIRGDFSEALSMLADGENLKYQVSHWDFVDLLYGSSSERYSESEFSIEKFAVEQFPESPHIYKPLFDRACKRQDFAAAAEIVSRAEVLGLLTDDLELRFKKFELAVITGDKQLAADLFTSFGSLRNLPNHLALASYWYLADIGCWNDIVEDLLSRFDDNCDFTCVERIITVAIRKTNRGDEILDAILQSDTGTVTYSSILNLILLDKINYSSNISFKAPHKIGLAQAINTASGSIQDRFNIHEDIRAFYHNKKGVQSPRVAVYLITNQSYLCGCAVALFSLLINNPSLKNRFDYFVFTDDQTGVFSYEVFTPIMKHFNIVINIVNLSTIMGFTKSSHEELRADNAIKFRIINYFISLGKYDLSIYFDSDVVVNAGLSKLLDSLAEGFVLAACNGFDRTEVLRGSEGDEIATMSCFDTGVLASNLNHPKLPIALENVIKETSSANITSLILDGSSSNFITLDVFSPLERSYNFFVRPHIKVNDYESVYFAPVIHFVDHPKPWDATYGNKIGLVWLFYWQKICTLLPEEIATDLYRVAARYGRDSLGVIIR